VSEQRTIQDVHPPLTIVPKSPQKSRVCHHFVGGTTVFFLGVWSSTQTNHQREQIPSDDVLLTGTWVSHPVFPLGR
jgi:hypothetical protein